MRKVLIVLPWLSVLAACGSSGTCTVTQDATTGVATITCADGSSVQVAPGAAGKDGEKGEKGEAGAAGANGDEGPAGASGTSCSVEKAGGVTTISCADGTSATVADGDAGAPGTSCTVTKAGGIATITCADGTVATVADGGPGPSGDAGAPGPQGTSCTVARDADAGVTTLTCADGTTATVLDGAQGPRSLVNLGTESPGVNCPSGGTRVESGVDTSGNGSLEPGEVTQTRYLCGGTSSTPCTVLEGSFTVTNTLDWLNLARSGCTSLTGELRIDARGLTALTPAVPLQSVGSLLVDSNLQLTEFGAALPDLKTAGRITFSDNPALTTVSFPSLETADQVAILNSPALTTLHLPKLASARSLTLSYCMALADLALPELASLTEKLDLSGVGITTPLELAKLTHAPIVELSSLPYVPTVSLPVLPSMLGSLKVLSNSSLTTLNVPLLASAHSFILEGNDVLASVTLPALELLQADLRVRFNPQLGSAAFPVLKRAPGLVQLQQNESLLSVSLPALELAGYFRVQVNAQLQGMSLPSLTVAQDLYLEANPSLTGLSLGAPTVGVGALYLVDNVSLASVSAAGLNLVGGWGIEARRNDALTSLSLPALAEVQGDLIVAEHAQLSSLALPALTAVAGNVVVSANPSLTNLGLAALQLVAAEFNFTLNPQLESFSLASVQSVAEQPSAGCEDAWPYHDDGSGTGTCRLHGTCAPNRYDDGTGTCVVSGCAPGYSQTGSGPCIVTTVPVAGGSASGSEWSHAGWNVSVAPYELDPVEVTVAQYSACMTAGGCTAPQACNWGMAGKYLHPINCVDWNQATAFCQWAGKRLPTRVEWQWAASQGGTTPYPWGNSTPDATVAQWSGPYQVYGTAPVGSHPAGATPDGIQDLSGNVREWTADPFDPLHKVLCGSAYMDGNPANLEATAWLYSTPSSSAPALGFRCAK